MTCYGGGTIVRVRSRGYDDNGDPIVGTPQRRELCDAFVAPTATNDIADRGRAGVVQSLALYAKFGIDLLHTDQVEVDGVLYDVDGEPAQWRNPFTGWEAGSETALKRAAG